MPVQMGLTFTHTNPWRNKKHAKIEMDIGTIGMKANKKAATFIPRKWMFHSENNKKKSTKCVFSHKFFYFMATNRNLAAILIEAVNSSHFT